jgi:aerobic C4-dicarboxylate transport protein
MAQAPAHRSSSASPISARSSHTLYIQVIIAVVLGAALGYFYPDFAQKMEPFGTAFINLIKMVIAPIIFVTVVVGIAKLTNASEVGRIGLKAIVYFEVLSTLAMVIGLIVGHVVQPGSGMNRNAASLDAGAVAKYTGPQSHLSAVDFLLHIIPSTVVDAFAKGEILQVLLFAVLFGLGLSRMGERGKTIVRVLDEAGGALFGVIGIIMRLAPIGAFGAMAFAIGKNGIGTLGQLGLLMLCFYATCALFVFGVLGIVARIVGLSIFRIVAYVKEEFLIVLGTSSSEAALPSLMAKLEQLGCGQSLVGLVVPLGYAFNLDGSSIYFTMAITFIAQALGVPLSWEDYALILGVLLLTSKGAAAVTGGGFITLAATLGTLDGKVPVTGMVLILGIDRFMSEARAITNLFGNTVATIFVAWWEGTLDLRRARLVLAGEPVPDLPELAAAAE